MKNDMIFYQLFEAVSCTYSYIIADAKTLEAAIIDPVLEMLERDFKLLRELNVNLKYFLDTHIHADHVTGAGELRKKTSGSNLRECGLGGFLYRPKRFNRQCRQILAAVLLNKKAVLLNSEIV